MKPAAQIDLLAIGYHPPSRMERLSEDTASVSLNFLDADHVLLTFDPRKLFQRLPGCPPGHDDRLVHAALLEVPSGRVVKEADWYLHDHRRYLWSLGSGQLLLRRWNSLYIVDSSLREKLLMASPKDLLWVSVTPDRSQIVVETPTTTDTASNQKPQSPQAPAKPEPKFLVEFLDAKTLVPQRTLALNETVTLDGTSMGYVDSIHKGDMWLIRFGPSPTQRHNITRVRSRTVPAVIYSSNNSLLVGRCRSADCDYSVTAFTLSGHRLWRQRWTHYRNFPSVERSEDNTRFGVSTLIRQASPNLADKSNDDANSEEDGLQQDVQVFETASGNLVGSVNVNPAVLSGQNFSLSPDGRRLAVLRGSVLQLFELPSMSEEEKTKFAALKADVPDLYTLASTPDSDSSLDADTTESSGSEDAKPATGDASAKAAAGSDANSVTADAAGPPSSAEGPSFSNAAPATDTAPHNTEDAAEPVATFKVTTKAVVVDVVVTDAKGRPVRGLPQQDFQVMEDGKPQDIRSFREFSNADPPAPKIPTVPASLPSNGFSNNTHTADTSSATVILLDLLNTPSSDQEYARQQLIKFLKTKPMSSQFALCTLSAGASRLRLIQGFTPDENLLLAAVEGKKATAKAVRWQAAASETANAVNTVSDLAQAGPMSGWQGLLHGLEQMQAEQQVTDTDSRAGMTMDSLILLARYLSGIPGRKNLVWLSGSFPVAIPAAANASTAARENRNYSDKLKRVTNLLAEAQIAVYPVDVRGIVGGDLNASDNLGFAPSGGPTSMMPGNLAITGDNSASPSEAFQQQKIQGLAQMAGERNTLTQVATATGGKAFYSSNAIQDAIATAVDQGSNYYSFSYAPANKLYDGKFRKIKVALVQKGYNLHYRQGYFADDSNLPARDADLARRTRAVAMQHGSPPSRQILFSVRVLPMGGKKKVDRGKVGDVIQASTKKPTSPAQVEAQHYGIDYSLDGSELRFMPRENGTYHNVFTLMAASFDNNGRLLSGISNVGTSNLEPAVYNGLKTSEFRVHQEVDVPVEAVSLRLGIQDQMSNHLGTVEIPLPVTPPPNMPRHVKHPLPEMEPD